ncbi:MAG: cyclic nucleotide-binding domain-containing protein [Pseudooceanicola sp.]|nr:cyclic nucleotide-binding domain-containing protein [Pseudooceanicola sp.]
MAINRGHAGIDRKGQGERHLNADHGAIARRTLLLRNCPAGVADEILSCAEIKVFQRGERIFGAGEPARAIHVVLDGWAKLFTLTAGGTEAVVGVFTREQSFGDAAALREDVYPVSAEAVTRCELMAIPASHVVEIMRRQPEVCLAVLSSTLFHLRALVGQVESLKARNGSQRVAQFLLSLTSGQTERCEVELPHDKSLIAGRLGMNPESLSRAFARLKVRGVEVLGNTVQIRDVADLARFSEVE